jgi:hypothetical protein
MDPERPRAEVLDAGASMAFERDDRRVRRVIELAAEYGGSLHVPSGAIGQIWRDGTWQACLARLVRSGLLDVQDLDLDEARAAGSLCGLPGTVDVAEASVAPCPTPPGRRHHQRP